MAPSTSATTAVSPGARGGWRPLARASDNSGGRIERIDIGTGRVEVLYRAAGYIPLAAPNDIVFDRHGGFFFTDHGHRNGRRVDVGAVFHAKADGSAIREVAFPLIGPNGIGLSPAGDRLYVAETSSGRLWSYPVVAPGTLGQVDWPSPHRRGPGGRPCPAGFWRFDSLAVEAEGNIAVATAAPGVASSSCRRAERWSSASSPTIPTPPTSASAVPTAGRPSSRCPPRDGSSPAPWGRPGLALA